MNKPTDTTRPAAPRPTVQMAVGCVVIPLIVTIALAAVFFTVRAQAASVLVVPEGEALLVRAAPNEAAPLLARFGPGRPITITGRSNDWRWLEIDLWNGRPGWALRPLDILVYQIDAEPVAPVSLSGLPPAVVPVQEDMIFIPAATFTMGSPPGIGENDERPAHVVKLSPFAIDRTEVTVGQYWACVLAGVCRTPARDGSETEPHYLNDPAFDNHPVINVTWEDANTYCAWRGKRLPTEAEWELVAGWHIEKNAKLQWPWGSDTSIGEVNVGPTALADTAVVGSFPADVSPVGALDMGGNVSEWVFDWYKADYYGVADDTDPLGPTHRRGEGSGRVVRGGSFAGTLQDARAANRQHQEESYGYSTVGFRCAADK